MKNAPNNPQYSSKPNNTNGYVQQLSSQFHKYQQENPQQNLFHQQQQLNNNNNPNQPKKYTNYYQKDSSQNPFQQQNSPHQTQTRKTTIGLMQYNTTTKNPQQNLPQNPKQSSSQSQQQQQSQPDNSLYMDNMTHNSSNGNNQQYSLYQYSKDSSSKFSNSNYDQNSSSNNNSNMQTMDEKTPVTTIYCLNNQDQYNSSYGTLNNNSTLNLQHQHSQPQDTNKYHPSTTTYTTQPSMGSQNNNNNNNNRESTTKKLKLMKKNSYYDCQISQNASKVYTDTLYKKQKSPSPLKKSNKINGNDGSPHSAHKTPQQQQQLQQHVSINNISTQQQQFNFPQDQKKKSYPYPSQNNTINNNSLPQTQYSQEQSQQFQSSPKRKSLINTNITSSYQQGQRQSQDNSSSSHNFNSVQKPYQNSSTSNQYNSVQQQQQQQRKKEKKVTSHHNIAVANEKFTKKLIIDLNQNTQNDLDSSQQGDQQQNSQRVNKNMQNNTKRPSNSSKYSSSNRGTSWISKYRESSLDNSFTRKPCYNESFRRNSKSPLHKQISSHFLKEKNEKNASFSVNNSLNNSAFNSSLDNVNSRQLTSSFSRLRLQSKNNRFGKSPNSHREINDPNDNFILNSLNNNNNNNSSASNNNTNNNNNSKYQNNYSVTNKVSGSQSSTKKGNYRGSSKEKDQRSSTPNNKIKLNRSINQKMTMESFQNMSIQNSSKFSSSSRTTFSKTTYNYKTKSKLSQGLKSKDPASMYDKNILLEDLNYQDEKEEDFKFSKSPGIGYNSKQQNNNQSPQGGKTASNTKSNLTSIPYNFEINTEQFPNLNINIEEIKKDRQRLIRKIQATFKVKNKAPSTSQEFYKILHVIGKGAFAKVCLGIQLLTGKFVAVKLIDKSLLRSEGAKNRVLQEVLILKKLSGSKHIIRLLEVFENRKLIFIVMEHIKGQDLMQIMKERGGQPFTEFEVQGILTQILTGLRFCQENNVLHRDIKLDNVLMDKKMGITIIDFGISRVIHLGQKMTEQCGTPAFLAPEIITNKGYEGFGSDIWSLGILLYILLYGRVPFKGNNLSELHRNITNGILPQEEMRNHNVSEEAQDLLKKVLQVNVKQRLNFKGIATHPWLKSIQFDKSTPKNASQMQENGPSSSSKKHNNNTIKYISEDFVSQIESFGYNRDYIYRCLEKNGLSHVNAIYHLISQ